jgi:hypothetical protein
MEELSNAGPESLADLVDNAKLDGVESAADNVVDCGFGDAAADIELVLGHLGFVQKFLQTKTHSLIQFHGIHRLSRIHYPYYMEEHRINSLCK